MVGAQRSQTTGSLDAWHLAVDFDSLPTAEDVIPENPPVQRIVAALAAFFTVGCAAQAKVQREGIHIDTVRVDYIIRSRSFTTP